MELKHVRVNRNQSNATLLIVPYGIETAFEKLQIVHSYPFNRTLWN